VIFFEWLFGHSMWENTLYGVVRDPTTTAITMRQQEFDSLEDFLGVPSCDWRHILENICKFKAKTVQGLLAFFEHKQHERAATSAISCRFFNSEHDAVAVRAACSPTHGL